MFYEIYINIVNSVKRIGFNECTGILKEKKMYYCDSWDSLDYS